MSEKMFMFLITAKRNALSDGAEKSVGIRIFFMVHSFGCNEILPLFYSKE